MQAKLSLLIPTYKHNEYLINLIKSILQALKENDCKDLVEIIISDDDPSNTELDNFILNKMAEGINLKYIKQEKRLGPDENFMFLLKSANGDFVMLLHDYWLATEEFSNFLRTIKVNCINDYGLIAVSRKNKIQEKILQGETIINNLDDVDSLFVVINNRINKLFFESNEIQKCYTGFCLYYYFYFPWIINFMIKNNEKILLLESKEIFRKQEKKDTHLPYQLFLDHTYSILRGLENSGIEKHLEKKILLKYKQHILDMKYIRHTIFTFAIINFYEKLSKIKNSKKISEILLNSTKKYYQLVNSLYFKLMPFRTKIFIIFFNILISNKTLLKLFYYFLRKCQIINENKFKLVMMSIKSIDEIIMNDYQTYWERAGYVKTGLPYDYIEEHLRTLKLLKEQKNSLD